MFSQGLTLAVELKNCVFLESVLSMFYNGFLHSQIRISLGSWGLVGVRNGVMHFVGGIRDGVIHFGNKM